MERINFIFKTPITPKFSNVLTFILWYGLNIYTMSNSQFIRKIYIYSKKINIYIFAIKNQQPILATGFLYCITIIRLNLHCGRRFVHRLNLLMHQLIFRTLQYHHLLR